jgi:hypothetical protein
MGDRYRNQTQSDRGRPRFEYDEQRQQGRSWEPHNDYRRDTRERQPYSGYYNERQFGSRGPDEREQGPRYGSEEGYRQWPREGYRHERQRFDYPGERERSTRFGDYDRPHADRNEYPERYEDSTLYVVGATYMPEDAYRRGDVQQYPRRDWGAGPAESDYSQQLRRREHDSFSQQVREAGQRIAQKVKRVFRGPKGYKRSDERIREDVSDRLGEHAYLDCTEIEVTVSQGEVTLIGVVHSRQEKFLAEEIADDVSGVNDVHNQLRVKRDQGLAMAETSPQINVPGEAGRGRNARA